MSKEKEVKKEEVKVEEPKPGNTNVINDAITIKE